MERDTLTLTIHGLPAFKEDVDGEVFARKFFKFMQGLAASDETVNGSRRLRYLIEKLEKNTATAAVREQISIGTEPYDSGIDYFRHGVYLIYHNLPKARQLPMKLLSYVQEIAKGAGETFAFGEIKASNDNVLLVDQSLLKNCGIIIADIKRAELGKIQPFSGVANVSLDGTIVTLEGRGEGDKAVVRLTAGGKEVECLLHRISDYEMRQMWKTRCTVTGIGHYSGNGLLPDYIEAVSIVPIPLPGQWDQWRGVIAANSLDEDGWN